MTDYLTMIRKLEDINDNPDTSEAQKEANVFRIKWLKGMHRDQPEYTPRESTDVIWERLKNPNYSYSVNNLLSK